MRIGVLVKQIPAFEEMELGLNGRLRRDGKLEMNAYCRRAVSQAVALAASYGGRCTVFTLGPPAAEDTLREAIAWAIDRGVDMTGVHVCDEAFAGSDTLATARALAAAIRANGEFDLILAGRNSIDADTGQVGPQVAELLDLAFVTGVRRLEFNADTRVISAHLEHDDGSSDVEVRLPAILSTAERLIDPAKVDPEGRAAVPATAITRVAAAELGAGPWGEAGSPTRVGDVKVLEMPREKRVLSGTVAEQVREAVDLLEQRGALDPTASSECDAVVAPTSPGGPIVTVVTEVGREALTRELLTAAARLAADRGGTVAVLGAELLDDATLGGWGADSSSELRGSRVPEDVADALATWVIRQVPEIVLLPSTAWGREVASRIAARLGVGLVGDAVGLDIDNGRLVAWKPAFGGQLVAAITCTTPLQMATIRAGALAVCTPRTATATRSAIEVGVRGRVRVLDESRDDDIETLAKADAVVGIGQSVPPEEYAALEPLLAVLGAELGATRKVTDKGWLPRARQIGITGRSIAPRLYVAIAIGGKLNHTIGVRAAGTVLAVNTNPDALMFGCSDIGIVGDWHEVITSLTAELTRRVRSN